MTRKQAELLLALQVAGCVVKYSKHSAFMLWAWDNDLWRNVACYHHNRRYWVKVTCDDDPTYVAGIPEILAFIEAQRRT